MFETLTIVLYGQSGVGKTTLADTAPGPRLVLDVEGGVKFTKSRKVLWDVDRYGPPEASDSWETCVVQIRDFNQLRRVYDTLATGNHPFKSVVMDSLTEIQKRCIDALVGVSGMDQQDWGALLRQMESAVRQFRDLTMHPTNPVQCVVITALASQKDGRFRPHVQGQLGVTLPGYVDVVAYEYTRIDQNTGELTHELLTQAHPNYEAKDRTGRLPNVIEVPKDGSVDIDSLMGMVFGRIEQTEDVSLAQVPQPQTNNEG